MFEQELEWQDCVGSGMHDQINGWDNNLPEDDDQVTALGGVQAGSDVTGTRSHARMRVSSSGNGSAKVEAVAGPSSSSG